MTPQQPEQPGAVGKTDLVKAKKAMPPEVVQSMLADIAKIDPRQAMQTGTLGKVGRLTAHVVDPKTLAIHHGITGDLDISQGATHHHTPLVPRGHLYVPHGGDPRELPDKLLGRAVESHLMDQGWQQDQAVKVAKHLQTAPQLPPQAALPGRAPNIKTPKHQPMNQPGMMPLMGPGVPPMMGGQ